MNLFIDTNIYLKFYHFTSDELEELSKLIVLVDAGEIILYLPIQILNEFRRNREVKIADALKKFKEEKLNNTFPVFCKEYKEFKNMTKAIAEYNSNKKQLLEALKIEIETNSLKADKVTSELFSKAKTIDFQDFLIEKAKLRFDLGNPPGKNNSYGDAISWETLLSEVPANEDLYFLSDDKDYFSEIDNKNFNKFLEQEWNHLKNSEIIFFKSLSYFFKEKYPDIKLATELQKDLLISRLEDSGNFSMARMNLHRLSAIDNFNSDQINKIMNIASINTQIHWIGEDEDINEILFKWYDEFVEVLTDETKSKFNEKVKRRQKVESEDLPF